MTATAATTEKLALLGGPKSISEPFKRYNSIGREEVRAATEVLESGVLSEFLGAWHENFYGGAKVRQFENAWAGHFGVAHAVSVNSATSGLVAAVGAVGIEPGDEVIVSPWTMAASATAILAWNGIPVFADIERETFNLDPASVEANVSPHTRAIMAPDIFGHSADMVRLRAIADRHGLRIISDTAQAPGAMYHGRFAGTLADVGVFSLNYHKHIHTGEGGVVVCNDSTLADRLQLIRNHAEAVVGGKGVHDLSNMIGYNFRLGEIEAAIGLEQLKKLPRLVATRQRAAERLTTALSSLPGLRTPVTQAGCTHVFYMYPLLMDAAVLGVSRAVLHQALVSEGVTCVATGYQNIHLLPMYQKKVAYGNAGFPWVAGICKRDVSYAKGICPTAESLHDRELLNVSICTFEFTESEVDALVTAFRKVWANLDALRDWAPAGTSH